MSIRMTFATAARVLRQLRRDHRTVALLLVVPLLLMGLLAWIYYGTDVFDPIGAPLLGVFPFLVMFLVTSIATLRERQSGTLERLLTMPLAKADLIGGYAVAFGTVAGLQALLAGTFALTALRLDIAGPAWMLVVVAVSVALLGTALGLFVSAFAATEFQAVQFLPAIVLPQFLLCGLLVRRDDLPPVLSVISDALPLSYAIDAMRTVSISASPGSEVVSDVVVVLAFTIGFVVLGAATLRRRTQ
ncbi:ABC transporter permease [Rhodococcus sp. NPDC078407]|uniref:ABC transporter permease n=1 Tax=Rhodococcus sp. NPDC078407 TaxID=3364509 RepID=UPI0037CC6C72